MDKRAARPFSGADDDGFTELLGGARVPKCAPQPEAYGTVDEASAALGLARASGCHPQTAASLRTVQGDLVRLMADLARSPQDTSPPALTADRLAWLEAQTAEMEGEVPPPREFVLPGDSLPGAFLHQARTVVRRAERLAVGLAQAGWPLPPLTVPYLNRLSSYLFALALWEDRRAAPCRVSSTGLSPRGPEPA